MAWFGLRGGMVDKRIKNATILFNQIFTTITWPQSHLVWVPHRASVGVTPAQLLFGKNLSVHN
jgi:hypothetical protein